MCLMKKFTKLMQHIKDQISHVVYNQSIIDELNSIINAIENALGKTMNIFMENRVRNFAQCSKLKMEIDNFMSKRYGLWIDQKESI